MKTTLLAKAISHHNSLDRAVRGKRPRPHQELRYQQRALRLAALQAHGKAADQQLAICA
jgi:hypothetical protein